MAAVALQMATAFGPTFSIGIRDDNQQNAVLVAKKAPERYDPDDLDIMDLTHYKHQLQDSATQFGQATGIPYNMADMLYELYRILPNKACADIVYELEIDHI